MRDVFPELSLEHNRQILDKALKKMRVPFRVKKLDMLEYCEEAMSEIDDKEKNVSNVDILDTLKGQLMDMLANAKQNGLSLIRPNSYPNRPIMELNLPTNVRNSLHRRGIGAVYDLDGMTKSDLLSIRGIGAGGAEIVIQTCRKLGINIPEV